jgi:uncharacterized membrane protein YphA (DoxX/SURF4 family)
MKRFAALDQKLQGWAIGTMRIVVGLLWLANIEWKRPSDFGLDNKNGLYKYVSSAVENPVFGPYKWFVENVVMKNYRTFGWITLITEMLLAALLIIGFKTRWISLVGVGLSVSIALSVLNYDKAYEWPWSYYLMVAAHLLLWACNAGTHLGVDGARLRGRDGAFRNWLALGVAALVTGAMGFYVSRSSDFFAKQGNLVGWKYETKILWFNKFSALLTVGLGIVLIIGALTKMKVLVVLPGAVFALLVLQVLAQWRYNGGEWTGGFTGATGATAAFWLALAVGVFATFRTANSPLSDKPGLE